MGIRFMLFPLGKIRKLNRRFLWVGSKLDVIFYSLKYDLIDADIGADAQEYLTASFISAAIYLMLGAFFGLLLANFRGISGQPVFLISAGIGIFFFALFFALHILYPRIIAKQKSAEIDESLIFALNNIMIQLSSGIGLYDAMANASKAGYGIVSNEFGKIVDDINSGMGELKAIEKAALKSKSDYFKKALWQVITSMRSGASLYGALGSVVESLNRKQSRAIRNYSAELNLWILIFLLGAAAIPSLGITFVIMLSALGGASIKEIDLIFIAIGALLFQVFVIGLVRTRVPKVITE